MNSIVTEATALTIINNNYGVLSASIGVIAIILLIALLVLKEMIRVSEHPDAETRMQTLDIVIAPLLITVGLIIILRIAYLTTPFILETPE